MVLRDSIAFVSHNKYVFMINMKKRSDTNYITPFNYYELGIACILDLYALHMLAALYASTDADGT